jgi:hypothetical protein
MTWPRPGFFEIESCSVREGTFAELSASIHGKAFWQVQLDEVSHQRLEAERMDENWEREWTESTTRGDAMNRKIDGALRIANESLAMTYRRFPSLAPSPEAERLRAQAKELLARADAIEWAEKLRDARDGLQKRISALKSCELIISKKLR